MRIGRVVFVLLLAIGLGSSAVGAQTRVVTGSVREALSNQPLVGAEVSVRGTVIRVLTAADGTFALGVPPGPISLLIRRIGYQRAVVEVPGTTSTVAVTLRADVLQLDEIVVSGQATGVERRNLTNAIATVSGDELERVPTESIERQLQGRVAGANIQSNSGAPGGGLSVELRGVTSFIGGSPLYVVDGVIVSDEAIPSNINAVTAASGGSNASLTQDNQVNRIVDLNPADIESIEILKGASASAIYGSKASNGVIIITTRRGRAGAPQVNVSQRFGFFDLAQTLTREINSQAEAETWLTNIGLAADAIPFDPNRNVERDLAGRNALSHETQLSVSGGSEDTRYFVSGAWKNDEGIVQNTGFGKQSLRINFDEDLSDRLRFRVGTNLTHSLARRGISNNDNTGTSPWFTLASTPRFANLTQLSDGTYPDNPFERSNPIQTMALMTNDEDVWRLIGSARVEVDLSRGEHHGLQFIGVGGVDRFSQENALLFPPDLQFEDDDGLPGTALLSNSDNQNVNVGGNLVYRVTSPGGGMNYTTSGGMQYQTRDLNVARVTTRNLLAGQGNINQGSNVQVTELRNRVEDLNFYLQEEVLVNERLMLTAGFTAEQSSANTRDNKLFFFPKAGVSYRLRRGDGFVSELKVRSAYGESGKQPLFGQKFSPLEGRVNIESILGTQVPAGINNQVVVTEIGPERQREFEIGVDATLVGGRANLEATFYNRRVSDLLLPRQLAPSAGFTQEIFNGGKLRVNGFEAAFGIVPVQTPALTWVFRSTFSMNRSKVTELTVPGFFPQNSGFGPDLGQFRIEQGQSVTSIFGNIPDGSGGASIGRIGDSNPDFRIGFTNDITVGSFTLFGLLDWQQGSDVVNLTKLLYDLSNNWKDCTDDTNNPCGDRLSRFGTETAVYLEDASYLKLREVSLSWKLPSSVARSIWRGIDNARLTFSGRNLITVTNFTGMDPEVSNFGNQAVGRNIDVAPFPRSRSFWFGIDLGF